MYIKTLNRRFVKRIYSIFLIFVWFAKKPLWFAKKFWMFWRQKNVWHLKKDVLEYLHKNCDEDGTVKRASRESAFGASRRLIAITHHFRVEGSSFCQGLTFPALRDRTCWSLKRRSLIANWVVPRVYLLVSRFISWGVFLFYFSN